jgi:hypothetical protein
VLAVGRGDDHRIRKPIQGGELAPVVEPSVGGHPELISQRVTASGAWIGDRHDARPVRILLRKARERAAP